MKEPGQTAYEAHEGAFWGDQARGWDRVPKGDKSRWARMEASMATTEMPTATLEPKISDGVLRKAADFTNVLTGFETKPGDVDLARNVMRGPPHSGRSSWHMCVLGFVTMTLRGDFD